MGMKGMLKRIDDRNAICEILVKDGWDTDNLDTPVFGEYRLVFLTCRTRRELPPDVGWALYKNSALIDSGKRLKPYERFVSKIINKTRN